MEPFANVAVAQSALALAGGEAVLLGAQAFGLAEIFKETAPDVASAFRSGLEEGSDEAMSVALRKLSGEQQQASITRFQEKFKHPREQIVLQRSFHRKQGQFDTATLTPAVVDIMHREEKVQIAENFMTEVEKRIAYAQRSVQALSSNDIQRLRRIHQNFVETGNHLMSLQPKFANPADNLWCQALYASGVQVLSFQGTLEVALRRLESSIDISWSEVIQKILAFPLEVEIPLLGAVNLRIRHTHKELAESLIDWLKINFPTQWFKGGKFLFGNDTGFPTPTNHHSLAIPWPPNPKDLFLQRTLAVLGWKMDVRQQQAGMTVSLDIGTVTPEAADSSWVWKRKESGEFELAALNYVDTLSMDEEAIENLKDQLAATAENLCLFIETRLYELDRGDKRGLEKLLKWFDREAERILFLFPRSRDQYYSLAQATRLRAEQRLGGLRSDIRIALQFLAIGRDWDETLQRVFGIKGSS